MRSAKVTGAFVAVLLVGLACVGTGSNPSRTAFRSTLNSMNSPAPTATVTYNYSVAYTLFPLNDTLVLGNVPIAGLLRPTDVAVDPGTGTLYVSNHDSANVTAINGATNRPVAWTRVGNYPQALAFDTANGNVYVPNDSSSNVSVIDGMTNHVVASVSVGINPSSIAFDPANGYIYVPNSGSDNVTVIDGATNEVVASIPVAAQPAGIAVDTANDRIFVSSGYTGNVTVIDGATNRVIAFIPPLGSRAGAAAFDPANGYVYISAGDKVVVVNGATYGIVAVITTNGGVWDLVVDRATGFLLATNPDFDTVTVIDGRTNERITTVPVGMDPEGLAFNPVNGYVYVANRLSGTLSLLASQAIPTYPVTFTEKGLPAGSNWSVNLDSSTWSSTNDTIVFSKPNGTHSFSVEAGPTYLATPANGIVVVAGAAVTQTIAFAPSSSAPMWFGLPLWEGYALVALILVLAVGLGAILLWRGRRGKAPPSPPMELRRS